MGLIGTEIVTNLAIEKKIAKTIKNRFTFVFLPTLRTMRMCAYDTIGTIIYEIAIASNDLWRRHINIFDAVMRQYEKIIHPFLGLYNIMVHSQVVDIGTAQAFMFGHIVEHAFISSK